MLAVPADTPDTIPELATTVAISAAPELHVPPEAPSLSVVVLPWHTAVMPVTGVMAFTVRLTETVHPAGVL